MSVDFQRSSVYQAENIVHDFDADPEYTTLKECYEFQKEVITSDYWQAQKGYVKIKITDGRGRSRPCYWHNKKSISLPKHARSRWVIIHEMAHALTHRTHPDCSAHGKYFCMHYLALVRELLGYDTWLNLREAFIYCGVRYSLPLKENLNGRT